MVQFAELWMDLEPVTQSEVSQREKQILCVMQMKESRKLLQTNLCAKQKLRCRCREQTYGHQAGKGEAGHYYI